VDGGQLNTKDQLPVWNTKWLCSFLEQDTNTIPAFGGLGTHPDQQILLTRYTEHKACFKWHGNKSWENLNWLKERDSFLQKGNSYSIGESKILLRIRERKPTPTTVTCLRSQGQTSQNKTEIPVLSSCQKLTEE
jgi:hypothetical protein